jgi:hypothetical protein
MMLDLGSKHGRKNSIGVTTVWSGRLRGEILLEDRQHELGMYMVLRKRILKRG